MKCKCCQAEMEEGENICPVCGEEQKGSGAQSMQKKSCPKCGLELEQGAKFCMKCGHDFTGNGKKKRGMLWIVILLVAVLVAGSGGTAYYMHQREVKAEQARLEAEQQAKLEAERQAELEAEQQAELEAEQQRQELIQSYQSKAIELYDEINKALSNFDTVSNILDTCKDEFERSIAVHFCSSQMSDERSRKVIVDLLYREFGDIECEEDEVQELKKVIPDCYKAYCDRYELLINDEFFDPEFVTKNDASKKEFESKCHSAHEVIRTIKKARLKEQQEQETEQ